MPVPVEVLGEIACGGESHRLLATRDDLRLLDHEDEKARVFDVLSDGAPCTHVAAAWQRLLERHVGSDDDPLYLGFAETLMPDREFSDWYDEHLAQAQSIYAQRFPDSVNGLLLTLPEGLRYALALQFLDRTLAEGGVRDAVRAGRLRAAVAACWESFAAEGEPSPADRRRLVWDLRAHRWGPPP